MPDPFSSSQALADWAVSILTEKGIDQISTWRMLEYWVQVELYRAIQAGAAGSWRHVGEYEQPYHTVLPRPGSKSKTKWIDLVVAEPVPENPRRITWIELKDIGRSQHTLKSNARGLGYDLAAVFTINPSLTRKIWENPGIYDIDRGRLSEWQRLAPGLEKAVHLCAQIVLVPHYYLENSGDKELIDVWLKTFRSCIKHLGLDPSMVIARQHTQNFILFALVGSPSCSASGGRDGER